MFKCKNGTDESTEVSVGVRVILKRSTTASALEVCNSKLRRACVLSRLNENNCTKIHNFANGEMCDSEETITTHFNLLF